MSRAEALRVLATAEDVPEKDRRVAELMLAGPEISFTEEQALRRFPSKRPVLDVAVKRALLEHAVAIGREREAAMAGYWYPPDDHAMEPQTFQGSGHSVSSDPPPRRSCRARAQGCRGSCAQADAARPHSKDRVLMAPCVPPPPPPSKNGSRAGYLPLPPADEPKESSSDLWTIAAVALLGMGLF